MCVPVLQGASCPNIQYIGLEICFANLDYIHTLFYTVLTPRKLNYYCASPNAILSFNFRLVNTNKSTILLKRALREYTIT